MFFFSAIINSACPLKMIFEPELRIPVPTKDLLSFIFDDPEYDQDDPVFALFRTANGALLTES